MARIKKIIKIELTNEEKEIFRKASKILEELAEEDGADEFYDEVKDNYDSWLYHTSNALNMLRENSD
jgi:hypothetical protein